MANHISPAAQLFRSMAQLIDHDHTSQTDYEAVTKAAEALAARASTEQLVAGPLWEADGASLLAAAYAFHTGLPRQAATASHIQALLERGPALVGAEAARLREVIDLNDPTTPTLAVVTLGWLEAAEQVLTAGSTAQDLQVLLKQQVAGSSLPGHHVSIAAGQAS